MHRVAIPESVPARNVPGSAVSFYDVYEAVDTLVRACHGLALQGGWWTNLETGTHIDRNVGELLCLVHSEISEAMEGHRKNLNDDKLPARKMFDVELADAIVRICDLAGGKGVDLAGALTEKLAFNSIREDHTIAHRQSPNGKKY